LERAFRSKRLGDSNIRLVIPAYAVDKEDIYVFKTRHHIRFQVDWKESAVNVALATAAAPTYFQAHLMPSGAPLIDGGIWANNPAGLAAVEARSVLEWKDDDLYIVRLGGTEEVLDIPLRSGRAHLLRKTAELFMKGQSRAADGTAKLLSNHKEEDPRYFSIQPKTHQGMFTLDGINMIERLRGLGADYARDKLPLFDKYFLYEKAEPFYPFPPTANLPASNSATTVQASLATRPHTGT
jgi:patatin-like phospholipase/acyl hydrolase